MSARGPFPEPPGSIEAPEAAAHPPFPTAEGRDWPPAAGVPSRRGSGPHPEPSHPAEPLQRPRPEVAVPPWPEVAVPPWPAPASRRDRLSREAVAADRDASVSPPLLALPDEPAAYRALGGDAPPRIRSVTGLAPWPDLPRSALAERLDDEGAWLDRQVRGADPLADEQRSV